MNKENWEIMKLGECFDIIRNGANIKQYDNAVGYPITRIETLSNDKFNRDRLGYANIIDIGKHKNYLLKNNDILVSHINSTKYLGRAVRYEAINNEKIIHGMNLLNLSRINSNIIPKYITYFFKTESYKIEIFKITKKAVNQASFTTKALKEISIPIPPLPIQEAIVKELDTLHRLKELQEQQLDEYDNLAQSTFYSMFGDPVENERGWELKKLGEVCEITSSKRIFAHEYKRNGVPFYRSKEIIEKGNKAKISFELFISKERYSEIKDLFDVPKIGDILMTAVGTIGEIWVVDTDDPFYFKDGNIVWLKMNKSISSTFFEFAITKLVNVYKKKMSIGSAYSALTIINLKNMQVILPPLPLQSQFANRIKKIEEQKELVKQSISQTQLLIDYTMDKYFG